MFVLKQLFMFFRECCSISLVALQLRYFGGKTFSLNLNLQSPIIFSLVWYLQKRSCANNFGETLGFFHDKKYCVELLRVLLTNSYRSSELFWSNALDSGLPNCSGLFSRMRQILPEIQTLLPRCPSFLIYLNQVLQIYNKNHSLWN